MGKKFNPNVVQSSLNCPFCKHQIVYTIMWHHLYANHCNCMCDKNIRERITAGMYRPETRKNTENWLEDLDI